jgi:hypothetical protein
MDAAPTFVVNALMATAGYDVLPDGTLTTVCAGKHNLTTSFTMSLKCISLSLSHEADLHCK